MNTCLSTLYLKLSHIDPRYIRVAFIFLTLMGLIGKTMALPISGDVGG
jgi:hypothetical protein